MLDAFITIDTEYSVRFFQRYGASSFDSNYARSILGEASDGETGICYQMDVLDRHGLRGVFFVDPMPALVWGQEAVDRVVHPILERGHDVQLHIHTEWLAFAADNPLGNATGRNMRDFSFEQQKQLIILARDLLIKAGAAEPVAFRAGNYGANDDTLRALASLGIKYDSSFCPGMENSECSISLPSSALAPTEYCGVIEMPVGQITSFGSRKRHAQLTAMSFSEMKFAILKMAAAGFNAFTIVSHSFEFMSRDRTKTNVIVRNCFEKLCRWIEMQDNVDAKCFSTTPPDAIAAASSDIAIPSANHLSGVARLAEQMASNLLCGRY